MYSELPACLASLLRAFWGLCFVGTLVCAQPVALETFRPPAAYVPAERQLPAVHLHLHADPAWFPAGVKHKWVLDGGNNDGSSSGGQGRD